jgi:hypothetical protein
MGHFLREDHEDNKGPSSWPNAKLLVQDQINTTFAQTPVQVNLAAQASEGVLDDFDPNEKNTETNKGRTVKQGKSFKEGQGGVYTQIKNNSPGDDNQITRTMCQEQWNKQPRQDCKYCREQIGGCTHRQKPQSRQCTWQG